MEIRNIKTDELTPMLFKNFDRTQVVTHCLRFVDGCWVAKPIPFIENWGENEFEFLCGCLKNTIDTNGTVIGVFVEHKLKGLGSVQGEFFGNDAKYLELSSIHISNDVRGCGYGKKLFEKLAEFARTAGADKLYISSHSAVETQAFYQKLGCVDALEINYALLEKEPFDRQLEYRL